MHLSKLFKLSTDDLHTSLYANYMLMEGVCFFKGGKTFLTQASTDNISPWKLPRPDFQSRE